jgi:hypothetical protein
MLFAVLALTGCGKQGPPLAPLTLHPARIADFTARRAGATVYTKFTIPTSNQEGTSPADLARIEVYAFTAYSASEVTDLRDAKLVDTILVRRPPDPDQSDKKKQKAGEKKTPAKPEAAPAATAKPPEPGLAQGAGAACTETLNDESLVPVVVKHVRKPVKPVPAAAVSEVGPLLPPDQRRSLSRFYLAIGVSRKGQKSAPSQVVGIPLLPPPPPAGPLTLTVTEKAVKVTWSQPELARRPVQAPAAEGELSSKPLGMALQPPAGYDVYLVDEAPPAATGDTRAVQVPTPLNEKPLAATSFDDERMTFGQQRCYQVRVVDTVGSSLVEGEPSPSACVTPKDTFPPPAPTSLAAVAGEDAISLIWEGTETPDFLGYLVLRGEAPNGTLEPVTPAPIRETTFRDVSARRGVRYIYAVVALDNASPPNRSALSNKVEESIR